MNGSLPDCGESLLAEGKSRWMQCGILGATCALVIGLYVYAGRSGSLELLRRNAADSYYNILVQGFRAGQLSVKKEVPPGLAQLTDPYDPTANAPYRGAPYGLHDLAYYKGRLYLDFGVTPVLISFWPFVALTGHYLSERQAVLMFCAIGFFASVTWLRSLWCCYFARVSVGVVAACVLALGLATFVPVLLARCEVYEVAIACGYMLTMLALGAIWRALHEPERKCLWLVAASTIYGLAVGARPNLLPGAVILLVPVARAWRERRPMGTLLAAATGPIILIGAGLMFYNTLRFGNPFEFGKHYVLREVRQGTQQFFSLRYFWFNFRVLFLQPARWSHRFPFVREAATPSLPVGHWPVEIPFGVLTNIPLVWLALAAPLAWRGRSEEVRSTLRAFLATLALLGTVCAVTLCFFCQAAMRYEVEFLPVVLQLAVVGILGLERALADRLVWRRSVRGGWGLLLSFSVAFNLFAGVAHYAETDNDVGVVLMDEGKIPEAIDHFEQALRINPNYAVAHNSLGVALLQAGKTEEAIEHFQQALRIKPDHAGAHYNLGSALQQTGRIQDAISQYEQAVQINPNLADAHYKLGNALFQEGKIEDAIGHYEQAQHIKPDFVEAHYNLAAALELVGKSDEAIKEYEQALHLKPDFAEARTALARLGVVR